MQSWGLKHIIVGAYGRLGVVEVYDDRYLSDRKLRRLARFDVRKDPQQRKALVMWLWTYSDARHRKYRELLAAKGPFSNISQEYYLLTDCPPCSRREPTSRFLHALFGRTEEGAEFPVDLGVAKVWKAEG